MYGALFTALVFAATCIFTVYVPATRGYFNIGETMIYTAALLMGPLIGGLAGGVGAALADIFLGYGYYAPGTLVIKFCEGYLVGLLARTGRSVLKRYGARVWYLTLGLLAVVLSSLILLICARYYSGVVELTLLEGTPLRTVVKLYVPTYFWVAVTVLLLTFIIVVGLRVDPFTGFEGLSIVVGGCVMVLGYFLYEAYVLALGPWAAAVEIPVNLGQMTVGLTVALPLVRFLRTTGFRGA